MNLTVFQGANLPSVQSLSQALRSVSTTSETGVAILKMDKTGHWVFGADQTEIEDDSLWAVNPFSFVHGAIAWGDGEVLGEKMVPITDPLPDLGPAPPNARKGWEKQVGLSLKCMSGEDEGLEVRYAATSVGGRKAVQTLAVSIAEMVEKDPSKPVPMVFLKKEHYQHKSYGKIYTPVFAIQKWVAMGGESAPPVADEPPTEPRRRRRSS
jgi:hypothetical protein